MKHFDRQFLLIGVLIFISAQLMGQIKNVSPDFNHSKDWLYKIQNKDANFKELQQSFNSYWNGRNDYKGNGYKVFKRWEYINEFRVLPDGKMQEPDYVYKTYLKYKAEHPPVKSASGSWSIVAPTSYPINNTSQPTGMGRVNAIAFDPTDVTGKTIFIGSPSGGFWKTTNQGGSWTDLSSNMPTLGVSSILIHPTDPNIIYIGSGDRDAGDAPGMGVFKSTDGGSSWSQINSSMGNVTVGAMIMHPTDANTIIAATSGGIYKTTNGGASWTQKINSNFTDIKFKPGDPSVIYAAYSSSSVGARFYRSSNTGDNWTNITSGILNAGTAAAGERMVIGVTPANPAFVYLVQIKQTNKNFQALLRSTDNGLNFSTQSTTPNIFDYACDGSGTSSQATYDLCITVDPANSNTVYVGSINNWKSIDGGVKWTIVSHWSNDCGTGISELHADQHVYEWNNNKLYVGHDGGISYTANAGGSWTEITGNLAITQIYKLGQSATQSDLVLYGQQDNGSNSSVGSVLTTTRGGDGMECAVDYSNTNYCYNTYSSGEISRSTTGPTGSYSNIGSTGTNGIGADEDGAWVTPYFLHKTDPTKMFAGYENVFRCDNIKATPATSVSWSAISTGETTTCKVLEQSTANLDIVYVVRSGAMKRTDNANATAASVAWTACALPGGTTPTDVKAHPTDADIVYATAGYKIYKSSDKGATWSDISGTLPGLFINCLVIDKNANEGIYIGNQTGVWYRNALMPDWVLFSNSLPVVDIRELEIYYDAAPSNNLLKAATYGRGFWQSDLAEISVINPSNVSAFPASGTQINLSWVKNVADNDVMVVFSTNSTFGTPVDGTAYTAGNSIPGGGTVIYNGSGTSFNNTSLSPSTTCFYKAWSVNSSAAYSNGTVTINAMTDCVTAFGLPFEENFSTGLLPDCWRLKDNTGQGNWQFGTTSASIYSPTMTGNYAYINTYGNSNSINADLISPTLDLTNYSSNIKISFLYQFLSGGTNPAIGTLSYSVDNGLNWTSLFAFSSGLGMITYTSDLPTDLQGKAQVKFKWSYISTGNFYWAIDDIKITGTSTTLPTVVTVPVTGISTTSALSGGNVTSAGTSTVTVKGICWSISPNPVATGSHTTDGSGTGAYRSSITGLTAKTLYYVRAYATNTSGTSYGTQAIIVAPPVAIAATSVTRYGFTANWDASIEATNYSLDVSSIPFGNTALFENFNGFLTSGFPDYSTTLNNYLMLNGWTGNPILDNMGNAIINSSSGGYISTPSLDLSGNGGNYTLYFDLNQYGGSAGKNVYITHSANSGTFNPVATITIPASSQTQIVQITGGSSNSKIKIASPSGGSGNRFTIDNIRIEASNMLSGYTNLSVSGTSKAVTVPSIGTYYYRLRANGLNSTSINSNSITSSKLSVLAGGNWSAAATWTPAGMPVSSENVLIIFPGTVTVDINNAVCNEMNIQSGAKVEINPALALTVNGTLTNNAGTSGLFIKSDASGTGSLIHSTTNVNGTVERYMNNADWTNWKDGWHFLSSPVADQVIAPGFTTDPVTDYDFYSWYEEQNIWVNYKNTSEAPTWLSANNNSLNFVPGKGYMAAYNTEGTKQFSGNLNVSDIAVSGLTINGTSATNRSWHLVGNPFASALTWDASAPWSLLNIAGVAKIWNEADQSYSDLTSAPSSEIPATNGFMVQVASGTGSLTLPASKRVHSSQAFYKSASAGVKLIARNTDFGNAQESNIIINPDATDGFDLMYDGEFMSGYAPQFYSIAENEKLSTNSLPVLPVAAGIPFAFVPNEGINFSIEAKGLETFDVTTWLLDKKTNIDMNLTLNPVYNFTATSTDIPERFLLHFVAMVGVNEAGALEQSAVWYFEQKLIVTSQADKSLLEVCDLQGRIILKRQINGKGIYAIAFNHPLGFYVARLTGNNKVKTTKFVTY